MYHPLSIYLLDPDAQVSFKRILRFALIVGWLAGATLASAQTVALNGTWVLDANASENLHDASRALNDQLNDERREKKSKDHRKEPAARGSNKFQAQADATEELIREDSRTTDWGGPDEQLRILVASSIKLYQARKVAILYDGKHKRLLTVNAAGRAYSVSGTEITQDDVGRSLTFFDDGGLVIETSVYGAGKLIEDYRLDQSGQRLVQTLRVQQSSGGPVLEFKKYFNRS